jgi:hypothetical protein
MFFSIKAIEKYFVAKNAAPTFANTKRKERIIEEIKRNGYLKA